MTDSDPTSPDEKGQARKAVSSFAKAGVYIGSGFQFAAAIVVGLFAGWWLDGKLGTSPLLLIAGCLAGAVSGFWYLLRSLGGSTGNKDGSGTGGISR
jgi:F0F1-type ATP synthase assembly protein I